MRATAPKYHLARLISLNELNPSVHLYLNCTEQFPLDAEETYSDKRTAALSAGRRNKNFQTITRIN